MDVCPALGLLPHKTSYSHHLTRLTTEERAGYPRSELGLSSGRPLSIVSESGLYKLIMRSDKPEAALFQHWVTSEVLPSIRKTGKYDLADHGRTEMPLPAEFAISLGWCELTRWPTGWLSGLPRVALGVDEGVCGGEWL